VTKEARRALEMLHGQGPGLPASIGSFVRADVRTQIKSRCLDQIRDFIVQNYLLIFAGGGLGAAARYWVSGVVHDRLGGSFPFGTLSVNILGCVVIGLLMSMLEERFLVYPFLRMFLAIGVLGGFTTFSTFSFETVAMLKDGQFLHAGINIIASLVACLGGTWIGIYLGKLI
jgi:CrcB protein